MSGFDHCMDNDPDDYLSPRCRVCNKRMKRESTDPRWAFDWYCTEGCKQGDEEDDEPQVQDTGSRSQQR